MSNQERWDERDISGESVMSDGRMKLIFRMPVMIGFEKETELYVAHAPAVDIVTQGSDEKDAEQGLQQSIHAYLEEHYNRGTLMTRLRSEGWLSAIGPIEVHPCFVKMERVKKINLDVEVDLAQAGVPSAPLPVDAAEFTRLSGCELKTPTEARPT